MVKEYVNTIEKMCGRYSAWQIWNDFISISAIALVNVCDLEQAPEREKTYLQIVAKYDKKELEIFCKLMAKLVADLEKCADQDILGEVYQALSMNSKVNAQYFTPYNISKMMAQMISEPKDFKDEPQIVNEPACGSGVNLIALANVMKEKGINYQRNVYFVAQDIDPLVAKMCYIQMSLLGMPGIVIVGDTLASPMKGEYWLTPFHFVFGIAILQRYKKKQEQEIESQQEEKTDLDNDWLLELVGIGE
jgi:type I restriction-modification system DNA methylase subunit